MRSVASIVRRGLAAARSRGPSAALWVAASKIEETIRHRPPENAGSVPGALTEAVASARPLATAGREVERALRSVHRPLRGVDRCHVFVHGSWADGTRLAFSDLDNLVIIDDLDMTPDDQRRIAFALARVDLNMMRLDPLQHHGNWIIRMAALGALDESYLPLHVIGGALCIQGSPTVRALVAGSSSREGTRANIRSLSGALERFMSPDEMSLWTAKHLVSGISLMPAYVRQALGERVSKAEALQSSNVRGVFSPASVAAVEWATEARARWGAQLDRPVFRDFAARARRLRSGHAIRKFSARAAPSPTEDFVRSVPAGAIRSLIAESLAHARG